MNTVACLPPADTTDIDMEAGPSTELAELARLKAELQAEAGSLASLAAEMVWYPWHSVNTSSTCTLARSSLWSWFS